MSIKPIVDIYTDGSCTGNPGPGGWGALLQFSNISKKVSGYASNTTNNQMEILAAIEALKLLKKSCIVNLYTDSIYLQKGVTLWMNSWQKNNWKKSDNKPVKNVYLWKELQCEIDKHDINWCWIKGHNNNYGNVIADQLAVAAKKKVIGGV